MHYIRTRRIYGPFKGDFVERERERRVGRIVLFFHPRRYYVVWCDTFFVSLMEMILIFYERGRIAGFFSTTEMKIQICGMWIPLVVRTVGKG